MVWAREHASRHAAPPAPVISLHIWVYRRLLIHRHFLIPFIAGVPRFWNWINSTGRLRLLCNRVFVNLFAYAAQPRPTALTLWSPQPAAPLTHYVSWTGLVDRRYTARQLPPATTDWVHGLPDRDELRQLFRRPTGQIAYCPTSSALLGFFAQWFTDGFMKTDAGDPRCNTSTHEVDLCQLYGLHAADTALLRERSGGRLKSQCIDGQEYPPYLFENGEVRPEFRGLSYVGLTPDGTWGYRDARLSQDPLLTPQRKDRLFATGLERGNITIFFAGITTIFLREHNRLCAQLHTAYPDWDDDRLFETARNINIVQLLRIVVEDYVNHLSPVNFRLTVDRTWAERECWYRTNRINAEFNLLYRWHGLMPDELTASGHAIAAADYMLNNEQLLRHGLENLLGAASSQRAGLISLLNTPDFLVEADLAAMDKSRGWGLRSYNDYRELYSLGRVQTFGEISSDPAIRAALEAVYDSVDDVEFLVGLLAEDRLAGSPLGETMSIMVGTDAFTQIYTNPLLSQYVYGEQAFSEVGLRSIESTETFAQLVERNCSPGTPVPQLSFTHSPTSAAPNSCSTRRPALHSVPDTAAAFSG